jgi:hypothetical protein
LLKAMVMATDNPDSQIMNTLVRMVVPMRREFGRQLDVRQFLHDFAYAREVLEQALGSNDPRLLEYARYVEKRLHGPRIADTPAVAPAAAVPASPMAAAPAIAAAKPAPAPAPAATDANGASAEELRARVLRKYTGGLR